MGPSPLWGCSLSKGSNKDSWIRRSNFWQFMLLFIAAAANPKIKALLASWRSKEFKTCPKKLILMLLLRLCLYDKTNYSNCPLPLSSLPLWLRLTPWRRCAKVWCQKTFRRAGGGGAATVNDVPDKLLMIWTKTKLQIGPVPLRGILSIFFFSLTHSSQPRRFQLKCLIISTAVVGPNHLLLLIIYDAILKWYDEIRRDICVGYPFNFQPFEQTT